MACPIPIHICPIPTYLNSCVLGREMGWKNGSTLPLSSYEKTKMDAKTESMSCSAVS